MKKVIGVSILLLFVAAVFAVIPLKDVSTSHWAYEAVQYLIEKGILTGLPDGSFQGEAYLTRYQFSVALYKAIQIIEQESGTGGFDSPFVTSSSDVSTLNYQVNTLKGLVETIAAKMERMGKDYQDVKKQIEQIGVDVELQNQVVQLSQLSSGLETRIIDLEMENDAIIPKVAAFERQLVDHKQTVENYGLENQNLYQQNLQLIKKVNTLTWVTIAASVIAGTGLGISIYLLATQ
jgi:hypothetical protein